ncbi:MAG: hypothetical protein LBQ31_10080 [Bacteroidales bacterium]|jgi:hypothetical protein|nr:hypothetical protein [Bacteroidales bacterium]
MDKVSQFHWISHYVTTKCDVTSNYNISSNSADSTQFVLTDGCITESFIIDIYLNIKQFTNSISAACKYRSMTVEGEKICVMIGDNQCKKDCLFICKWMNKKHQYLFDELHELNKYLERVNNGLFKTEIKVNLHHSNKRLKPEYMDIIADYLSNT